MRTLLRLFFKRDDRLSLVGEASNAQDAARLVGDTQPDILLLDLLLGEAHGRALLPLLLTASPRTMVVIMSALSAADEAEPSFAQGAFAYLEKTALGANLTDHLLDLHARFQRALAGETVWAPRDPRRILR